MPITSLSYGFGSNLTVDGLVREAFERIGVQGHEAVPQKTDAAIRTANLILSTWASTQDLLFLVQREMFGLSPGQAFYQLPDYVIRILKEEVTRIFYIRQNTTGSAVASQGDASPCFDPASSSGLHQSSPNGWIGYSYAGPSGAPQQIWYVGVNSLISTNYTLAIEYTFDIQASTPTWFLAKQTTTELYYPNVTRWFVLEQPPVAVAWRIREIKGSTLAINQLYFATPLDSLSSQSTDITMGPLGRANFLSLPVKLNPQSVPSAYYFNEKQIKSMYVYGNDYSSSNAIVYNAAIYPQDISFLFQSPNVARKYFDPLCASMAYHLAIKYQLPGPTIQMLQMDAANKFASVCSADKEDVDIDISFNAMSVWDV